MPEGKQKEGLTIVSRVDGPIGRTIDTAAFSSPPRTGFKLGRDRVIHPEQSIQAVMDKNNSRFAESTGTRQEGLAE